VDRPLKEHIAFLERHIQLLSHDIMENRRSLHERNRIEAEIRAAQAALAHYRAALELEQKLTAAH
jgi:ABC-type protease/lipase transport system fused ATPase/permease subunit